MKMKGFTFTIDAENGLSNQYRLQRDDISAPINGSQWRCLDEGINKTREIKPNDRLFRELSETYPFVLREGMIRLGAGTYQVNPSIIGSPGILTAFIYPVTHRGFKPPFPSKEELGKLIAQEHDSSYLLVLNLEGCFGWLDFKGSASRLTPIAVRYEPVDAESDPAVRHEELEKSFKYMLEGWAIHLETGRLNTREKLISGKKTESELLEKIAELTAHLKNP